MSVHQTQVVHPPHNSHIQTKPYRINMQKYKIRVVAELRNEEILEGDSFEKGKISSSNLYSITFDDIQVVNSSASL